MAVVSGTEAVGLTKKKARSKKITKKGPGIFAECGKVRLGKSEDWVEVTSIGMQIFKSEPPQIGLWGIVKNGSKSFREIAAQVYGDAGKASFILDANKVYADMAFEGQLLYIPHLTYNRLKQQNELVNSNYYYTRADLTAIKPIMQISGDVYVPANLAYVNQYYYAGKDNNSRLVASEKLTFKEFCNGVDKCASSIASFVCDTDDQMAVVKSVIGAYNNKDLQYIKMRRKNGQLQFKINKPLKGIGCKPTYGKWVSYGKFVRGMFTEAFAKRNVISMIVIAGLETWLDWREHHNLKHAVITFFKEGGKAAISIAAGIVFASAFAILFPGVGWVFFGAFITGNYMIAKALDEIDEYTKNKGYQKWAY